MRVFLTGATGLIGSLLRERLTARGDTVVALSRSAQPASPGVAWVEGDPAEPGDWQRHIAGADAVVHLAGESIAARRWSAQQKERLTRSRIDSTRRIMEAMQAAAKPPEVLVCASAVGIYGPRGEEDLDETSAPGADFLARLCADWEAEARKAESLGATVVSLRFAVVLSRRGGALPRMLLPFKLFVGGPVGDPNKWFPWVHQEDALGLALLALDGGLRGPVNVASPRPARMRDFARAAGAALHRPALFPVPEFALRLLLGELAGAIVPGQKVHPRAALEAGYRFAHPGIEAALKSLAAGA